MVEFRPFTTAESCRFSWFAGIGRRRLAIFAIVRSGLGWPRGGRTSAAGEHEECRACERVVCQMGSCSSGGSDDEDCVLLAPGHAGRSFRDVSQPISLFFLLFWNAAQSQVSSA